MATSAGVTRSGTSTSLQVANFERRGGNFFEASATGPARHAPRSRRNLSIASPSRAGASPSSVAAGRSTSPIEVRLFGAAEFGGVIALSTIYSLPAAGATSTENLRAPGLHSWGTAQGMCSALRSRMRILAVDDDADYLEVLEDAFR